MLYKNIRSELTGEVKVKLSLCLTKHNDMKYCAVEVYLQAFFTSGLDGGEWSASRCGRFIHSEITAGINSITDWLGPRAGLDDALAKINNPCRWG
jgi:hypothetical protein